MVFNTFPFHFRFPGTAALLRTVSLLVCFCVAAPLSVPHARAEQPAVSSGSVNLLEAAAVAGDWASVLRQADAAIAAGKLSGDSLGQMYVYRSLALLAQNAPQEALTAAEKAAEYGPRLEDAWLAQGTAYLRLRDLAKAEQAYVMAHNIAPESWKPLRNMAVLASANGDIPAAIEWYEKALKHHNTNTELYAEYAVLLNNAALPAKAEAVLTTLSMLQPANPDVWNNRGMVRLALDKYPAAVQDFSRALEIQPNHAEALLNRGNILRVRGELEASLADFNLALAQPDKNDPVTPKLYIGRAYTFTALKRYEDVAADFAAAYELGNVVPYVMNEYAWFLATCPVATFRDGERAVTIAEQAILLASEPNVGMLDTLAAAHAEAGDFDRAVRVQEQVLRLGQALPVMMREEWSSRLTLYRKGEAYRAQ